MDFLQNIDLAVKLRPLNVLMVSYYLSILMLVIAVFVSLFTVLPLQIKESRVKNGLISLRKVLLEKGVIIIVNGILAIFALNVRLFLDGDMARLVAGSLILLFSASYLRFSLLNRKIWRHQFSKESKRLHEKIDKEERKRVRLTKGK